MRARAKNFYKNEIRCARKISHTKSELLTPKIDEVKGGGSEGIRFGTTSGFGPAGRPLRFVFDDIRINQTSGFL